MNDLPQIVTVQQALERRMKVGGLCYAGCQLIHLDWHPAQDGTHYAVIEKYSRQLEMWLKPETWLELAEGKPA